jgi:NTP pyrophosphatase (non-canonical NTP hydrolase)
MDLRQLTDDVETVSRRYAETYGFRRDDTWFLLKLQEEVGELTQAFLMQSGQARAKGLTPDELAANFRSEIADVLCHVLLLARHHNVDLPSEIERKWLHRLR